MPIASRNHSAKRSPLLLCLPALLAMGLCLDVYAASLLPNTRLAAADSVLPLRPIPLPTAFPLDAYERNALSGGPGKDGIPAIDRPRFISADAADRFLDGGDVIFGVVSASEIKAYPQRILVWHEIVNDRLGGENISVTYCPLTGTAMGFLRGDTTLGVSGRLVNSNLIMYDRATDSNWPQVLATAVSGAHKGRSLKEFRVIWTTWARWKQKYPTTSVLSTDTGYGRNYRRDPYGSYNPVRGYYATGSRLLFPLMYDDKRFDPKEVVIGVRDESRAAAFRKSALRERKIIHGAVGGQRYIAVYEESLDTAHIYNNPENKSFTYGNGRFQSGEGEWPADRLPLEKANAFDAMWFAWAAYYPETTIYD